MCLGIPAQITAIVDLGAPLAKVSVAGVVPEVNIACIGDARHRPEDCVGDWVLAHVGFAMSRIDPEGAERTLAPLDELGEIPAERDATRLHEQALPVRKVCEILGLDPPYLANEGKLVAVVPGEAPAAVLAAMCAHPAGRDSCIVGEVTAGPAGRVLMSTVFGGERVVEMLTGEQLPRIC
jgi:hydrogenase assembly chaperone HypC/HupF